MVKIFAYCVEDEMHKGTLHNFFNICASTHYLTDEYGMLICQGDVEYVTKRLKWFENNPLEYYKIRNKVAKIIGLTPEMYNEEMKMEFI